MYQHVCEWREVFSVLMLIGTFLYHKSQYCFDYDLREVHFRNLDKQQTGYLNSATSMCVCLHMWYVCMCCYMWCLFHKCLVCRENMIIVRIHVFMFYFGACAHHVRMSTKSIPASLAPTFKMSLLSLARDLAPTAPPPFETLFYTSQTWLELTSGIARGWALCPAVERLRAND